MGTKRHLASHVQGVLSDQGWQGRVLDLFSGMGSVATAVGVDHPIATNDFLGFTSAFARARFLDRPTASIAKTVYGLRPAFREHQARLRAAFRDTLAGESRCLEGSRQDLANYMAAARHIGNSADLAARAEEASRGHGKQRYWLCALYFAGGYFSVRQAIELDAIRYAIDRAPGGRVRDWLLSSWLAAAATLINSPGHTAQYLKPTTDEMARRIIRSWRRSIWSIFVERLSDIRPLGTRSWRRSNIVSNSEALQLIEGDAWPLDTTIVYADPPYTRDQYSRYYHVYETLYLYDFPGSRGAGRTPPSPVGSWFSTKSKVRNAFQRLLEGIAIRDAKLILSYPSSGLLQQSGHDLVDLLRQRFKIVKHLEIARDHSTLGASSGVQSKSAIENLYVCIPS